MPFLYFFVDRSYPAFSFKSFIRFDFIFMLSRPPIDIKPATIEKSLLAKDEEMANPSTASLAEIIPFHTFDCISK